MFLIPMRPLNTIFNLISFKSSNDPEIIVPARIIEKRYKISNNYKITLKSDYERFGTEIFYLSDLEKLIENGSVEFFIKA